MKIQGEGKMGDFDNEGKKVVLTEDYRWKVDIWCTDVQVQFVTDKCHSEDEVIKVKVTEKMLNELEACYRDIMVACYPELKREELFFNNKDKLRNSEIVADKYVGIDTNFDAYQKKYIVSLYSNIGFEFDYENRIDLYIYTQHDKSIGIEKTNINKFELIRALKKFICFMENGRQVEVADDIKESVMGTLIKKYSYHLEYRYVNNESTQGASRIVSAESELKETKRTTIPVSDKAVDNQKVDLLGNYGLIGINGLSDGMVKLEVCNLKSSLGNESIEIKGKVTQNMLDKLEDCYKDIMTACYPELKRKNILFKNIKVLEVN
jgi:hypothetical protein